MRSTSERIRLRRLKSRGLLAQVLCYWVIIMLSFLQMASAGRPSSIVVGSKAINVGLKEKFNVMEFILTEGTKPNQESSIISRFDLISRRHLNGLGSAPPQCTSKCRGCTPCKAVRVPIQPGMIKLAEYYPEAWRCQCGGNQYMP
ncbi:hypothetical protein O6H91_12G020400 [Diphasiastrum complanatum]|uniref:Uncharacterized protein n=2 Tax=Diphasiastrum complanatum TaxID=34168 RepID=A0ACC2BZK9_DIPCM|nr:hypothetical protein O6H91_12G007000 [Diphasiastrum complanatum]KAJ7535145.1 hypothetical protein O6H91_12G020400 [Diphasiastrum complanatum]